jgi:acyl-CoA reductase-like NAD-dependent aldehyde dehydrogenase
VTAQASFNPRNGLVVPAPAPDTPEAVDAEPLAALALAAGCPVAVKAHPAHPRLSARLAEIAGEAMAGAGVTTGPFGIVHGFDAGTRLVSHPAVRAVGYTGSLAGGLALWPPAAARPEVIPVYAEMGTVNTVVVTPSAAAERPAEIAVGFVASFTLGMGRFCTKPGLLLALSRWVRPVAFQDVPAAALPAALRDDDPWRVPRRVDGVAA